MAKRLAVIADSPRFLKLLERQLVEAGYDPFLFTGGETAAGRLPDLQPAAIIFSIHQKDPAADWELLDSWKLDPLVRTIPVVVSSADLRHLQERARYLESQGYALLPRPFAVSDLLSTLQRLIGGPRDEG